MPDFDSAEDDKEMAIKVHIMGRQYWPQDQESDCDGGRGYRDSWCYVKDEAVLNNCYELRNYAAVAFHERPAFQSLRITLVEDDFWYDSYLHIDVPVDRWYDHERCGEDTFEAYSSKYSSTYARIEVRSEVRVPTPEPSRRPSGRPSSLPTADPTHPTARPSPAPSRRPSLAPSSGPTAQCGIETDQVAEGLGVCYAQLENVNDLLKAQGSSGGEARALAEADGTRRRLLWGALVSGVKMFKNNFVVKSAINQGPLSTIADICTIGSTLFSVFGGGGDPPDPYADEFRKIFERFDQIDRKLDEIEEQVQDGFSRLELVVRKEFANEVLDDLIKERLAELEENYRAYLDPRLSSEHRGAYEDTFRISCAEDSPYTIFQALYGHSCRQCDQLIGQFNQYIMDTFVDLAIQNYDSIQERIDWFRSSYTTIMVGAAVKALFLHSVCLYQPRDVCQNTDPVWRGRLIQMADALEEIASSLSAAEERVKCRRKTLRVTHMCNLYDMDPAFIKDDDMDLRIEIDGERYWPRDVGDCTDGLGMFNNACMIQDIKLINGACYAIKKSVWKDYTAAKKLEIVIVDEDAFSFDDEIWFDLWPEEWYDSMTCEDQHITVQHSSGSYLKVTIKGELIHETWAAS